jgi:transcriptional regulator with XRE-family HTH domain
MATPGKTQRSLGLAVKALRTNLGITQEELSNRTGVHATYVSDIERGARNPSWATLVKLIQGMNATMAELGDTFDRIEAG